MGTCKRSCPSWALPFGRVVAAAAVLALASSSLSGCVVHDEGSSASESAAVSQPSAEGLIPLTASVVPEVIIPEGADLSVSVAPVAEASQVEDLVPSEINLVQLYDFTVESGSLPDAGVQIRFVLDEPLPDDLQATVVHRDGVSGELIPITTGVDGRSITASVTHFSEYGVALSPIEQVYYWNQRLTGNLTTPPECDELGMTGSPPTWADMQFFEDKLSSVLWCVSGVSGDKDRVAVRVVFNRGTAAKISTSVTPKAVSSDLFGDALEGIGSAVSATTLGIGSAKNQFVTRPLGSQTFIFERKDLNAAYHSAPNAPLIEVEASTAFTVLGLAYDEAENVVGPALGGVLLAASAAECGSAVSASSGVEEGLRNLVDCMNLWESAGKQGEKVAEAAGIKIGADQLDKLFGTTAKRLSTLLGWLKFWKIASQASFIIGDMTLPKHARQMVYSPSAEELKRLYVERVTAEYQACSHASTSEVTLIAGIECVVTSPVAFQHPAHGDAYFSTGLTRPTGDDMTPGHLTYWLLDESMRVLETKKSDEGYFYSVTKPFIDKSGNLLFEFNPGRTQGAVALRPTASGWEDFETSPLSQKERGEEEYDTRLYAGRWIDVDDDGYFEAVDDEKTNFEPDRPTFIYSWDGADYALPAGVVPDE